MDIEKVKTKIKEVIKKAAENYCEEKVRTAWVILAFPSDRTNLKGGTFLLTMCYAEDTIYLCWSPEEAGYGDLGTMLGSVSMEYFNLDHIANLIKIMYDSYVDDFE